MIMLRNKLNLKFLYLNFIVKLLIFIVDMVGKVETKVNCEHLLSNYFISPKILYNRSHSNIYYIYIYIWYMVYTIYIVSLIYTGKESKCGHAAVPSRWPLMCKMMHITFSECEYNLGIEINPLCCSSSWFFFFF